MNREIESWATSIGWTPGRHGHRFSVKDGDTLRLIYRDAPTRGYTNIFVKGRTADDFRRALAGVRVELFRNDPRYGGVTLLVPHENVRSVLREVARSFGV